MNKDKLFQTICYLVLMNGHSPYTESSPDYILEKLSIILYCNAGEAITFLDPINQKRVFEYCDKWGVEVPEIVKKYI